MEKAETKSEKGRFHRKKQVPSDSKVSHLCEKPFLIFKKPYHFAVKGSFTAQRRISISDSNGQSAEKGKTGLCAS